jgi:hypothetical protein
MQAIQDGGLGIVALPGQNVTSRERHGTIIKTNRNYIKNYAAELKKHQENYLRTAVTRLTSNLNRALRLQNKFILPGAGVFAMKHPTFNDRGDLLVELQYLK